MLDHADLLRCLVWRSVAAEETKAHALGEKEVEAIVSNSYADIREAKGGLALARAVWACPLVLFLVEDIIIPNGWRTNCSV